jgi:hypothetical protein
VTTISQDIFELVLLDPAVSGATSLARLTWRAPQQGNRVVQAYVNGRLYDVTATADQPEMWLWLDRSIDLHVQLLAVPAELARADLSAELDGWSPRLNTGAELAILRDESLAVDSRVVVSVDGAAEPARALWSTRDHRGGLGALFGIGGFGRDEATAPGLGLGEFATGRFGVDGSALRWRRDDLPPGEHAIDLHVEDARGRRIAELDEPIQVTIDALPQPARDLQLDDDFVLHWTD